jgi:hypothetical protein
MIADRQWPCDTAPVSSIRFLVLAFVLAVTSGISQAKPVDRTQPGHSCTRSLTELSSDQILQLVSGMSMKFAGEKGVCPRSNWITTPWRIDFHVDGSTTRFADRGIRTDGRYFTYPDHLCVVSTSEVMVQTEPNHPPRPELLTSTECFRLFRDAEQRLYLQSTEISGTEPAMIALRPIE